MWTMRVLENKSRNVMHRFIEDVKKVFPQAQNEGDDEESGYSWLAAHLRSDMHAVLCIINAALGPEMCEATRQVLVDLRPVIEEQLDHIEWA